MRPISMTMGALQVSPRLVTFGSIALIAASIGAAAAVATPGPSRCRVDPATGVAFSQGVSGVCIAPSEAGETEPGHSASRIDRLMQLDEEQWRIVELLLALTPGDWNALQAVVGKGTGVSVPAPPAKVAGLPDIINTVLARVNTIRSNLDSVSSRIPDRADVRNLLGQVELARLRDMLGEVRDTLQGFVDIASELRDGYDTFDVVQFRTRLGGVLTDLESASSLYQRLLCVGSAHRVVPDQPLPPPRKVGSRRR